ncbi:MAG: hypothetical protein M1274_02705 [Actinobacteria bacterium]|nr:hypothetical protein [Actinomycetota bacterium]
MDASQVEFHYVTAGPHYRHSRIIWFASRPFADVESMEQTLIERWNVVLPEEANVLMLGDFILVERELAPQIVARLNGHIHLLRGNHDRCRSDQWFLEAGFVAVDMFNVHGHIHRHCSGDPKHLCIVPEVTEYSPLTMKQLQEYVNPRGYHTEFRQPPGVPEFPPLRLPEQS